MDGTGPSLAVEGLAKSFGPVRAVDDLTFSVRPGAVTGFLGPNGAGKTTTLRMLLGLTRPTAGRALVGDRPYAEHPLPDDVAEHLVGPPAMCMAGSPNTYCDHA